MCKLPGGLDSPWIGVSDGRQQPCEDKANPCDLCTCAEGNPPKLVVDKDGCKKPKKCHDRVHVVGESWPCYDENYE